MEIFLQFLDIVLHLDVHLTELVNTYGLWIYAILFIIIFSETGLVIFPFLPGDSLLFVAGALAALGQGGMNIFTLILVIFAAAFIGNLVNFEIGKLLGERLLKSEKLKNSKFFNYQALEKTQHFYEKHGGKTIIISRFLPLFRTFAPFVAGIGKMHNFQFMLYNAVGAGLWVIGLCGLGYFFGNIDFVKKNLSLVIIGIIIVSLLPIVFAWLKSKLQK